MREKFPVVLLFESYLSISTQIGFFELKKGHYFLVIISQKKSRVINAEANIDEIRTTES